MTKINVVKSGLGNKILSITQPRQNKIKLSKLTFLKP